MTTTQILLGYLACGLAYFLSQMPMVWRMYRESVAAAVEQINARARMWQAEELGYHPELKERFDTTGQNLSVELEQLCSRVESGTKKRYRKLLLVSLVPGFFIALFFWPVTLVAKILGLIFGWKEPEGPTATEILQGEN